MSVSKDGAHRGQMLVIVGLGMVVFLAFVGVVIDGGYAWGQQRDTQNGTDAAAEAGAVALLGPMLDPSITVTDAAIWLEVTKSASSNGISVADAEYTTWDGLPTSPPAKVGPSDGNFIPTNAAGVQVLGGKRIDLFLAPIIGIDVFNIRTRATAVAGNVTNPCDIAEGCALLPIAFPATMVVCSDNGQASVPVLDSNGQPQPWPDNTHVIMPMCGGNPGSVGWLDWDPPFGGTSETVADILNPPALDIELPSWVYVTATGTDDAQQVEDAINTYAGTVVLFPLFDSTCDEEPTNPETSGCPPDHVGGQGVNQWYHLPPSGFAAFRLDSPKGAYLNGNNSGICDTGNGATDCIIGTFVSYVGGGTVGPPDPNSNNFGVQLIR